MTKRREGASCSHDVVEKHDAGITWCPQCGTWFQKRVVHVPTATIACRWDKHVMEDLVVVEVDAVTDRVTSWCSSCGGLIVWPRISRPKQKGNSQKKTYFMGRPIKALRVPPLLYVRSHD